MRNEYDVRIWGSDHGRFSASVARGLGRLADGFERLQRIEYAAPWRGPGGGGAISGRGRAGLGLFAGLSLAIGLAAVAEPALAAAPAERPALVSHADLNLAAAAGRATLDARIRETAKQLCADRGILTARSTAEAKQCMTAAIAGARPQIEAAVTRHRAGLLASRQSPSGQ